MKCTIGKIFNGKIITGKSTDTSFPGCPYTMGFAVFNYAMGNLWENPCISHVMKYGWKS